MFGFLPVNKIPGQSSSHVVATAKHMLRPHKVGHAGTLDPLARGVLVLCIGGATRLARFVQEMTKTYIGDFRLGQSSRSDDLECELVSVANPPRITRAQLVAVLSEFTGNILQRPPQFSALKINGKRAYRLARKGKQLELRERPVRVDSIKLLKFDYPNFQLRIVCGSGTYIRSIGRDIGLRLASGAVMTGLVRTAIGPFKIADAILSDQLSKEMIEAKLRPPIEALEHLTTSTLQPQLIQQLAHGGILTAAELGCDPDCEMIVTVDDQQNFVALLTKHAAEQFKPTINFAHGYT